MDYLIWVWLGITCHAVILEFVTQRLISLWFAVGGFLALITEACPVPFWAPIIVFFGTALPLLLFARKPTVNYLIAHNAKLEQAKKAKLQEKNEPIKQKETEPVEKKNAE